MKQKGKSKEVKVGRKSFFKLLLLCFLLDKNAPCLFEMSLLLLELIHEFLDCVTDPFERDTPSTTTLKLLLTTLFPKSYSSYSSSSVTVKRHVVN